MASRTAEIEKIQTRYRTLLDQKVRAQTQKEAAEAELKRLQQQASDQFGTSDVEQLQSKLRELEEQNRERLEAYQQALDYVDEKLKQVESHQEASQ